MSKRTVTPAGFTFNSKKDGKDYEVITVPAIEALVNEYRTARSVHMPIEFVGCVVKIARQLLGDNVVTHLSSLYENRSLLTQSDYNYDFLQDTVKFIETGNRPMSISARVQLMEFLEEGEKEIYRAVHSMPFGKNKRMEQSSASVATDESVYARWLRQPNGLNDMLCTIIVLFGKHNQLCCNK